MEVRWCSEQVARDIIAKSDRNKALFYRHILRIDWNDPMHYDMVLRTDILGIERIVDILAGCFESPAQPVAQP